MSLSASLSDVTTDVQHRLQPTRERLSEQVELGRARAGEALEHARDASEPVLERASEAATRAAEAAAPRVQHAREVAGPAVSRVRKAAVEGASVVADVVPSLLERIVAVLQALFGDLEEKGRELVHQVDPPASQVRRSRFRLVAWFVGGFAVGAGAGWFAHQRFADHGIEGAQDPVSHARDVAASGAPYGEDAAAIDARRDNVSLN